jgi:hypothetical protein
MLFNCLPPNTQPIHGGMKERTQFVGLSPLDGAASSLVFLVD